jgi:predicted RNase H-like nuclease (RuvC/YqgF family)
MSSRKNDMGADALDYIDVEDTHKDIIDLRERVKHLDLKIEELEDEVDKLNKINGILRDQLCDLALGLTE